MVSPDFFRPLRWWLAASLFLLGLRWQLEQRALDARWVYVCFTLAGGVYIGWGAIKFIAPQRWRVSPQRWGWARAVLLALAALALGWGSTGWRASHMAAQQLAPALEGVDLLLRGTVVAMPQHTEAGWRFRFAPEAASLEGVPVEVPALLDLGWYKPWGGEPGGADLPDLRVDQRWQLAVRLKAPHGVANPHGFDLELWLWEQGIGASGAVRTGAKDPAPQLLDAVWRRPIERVRQAVRDRIMAHAMTQISPGDTQTQRGYGVIAALVVGDQQAISRQDWDVFRATGVAHLVSISGLHITLFAWLMAGLVRAWWRCSPALCLRCPAPYAAALGGLALATLYALFSGWGVPAQRTVCMLAVAVLCRLLGLRWPWPAVALVAAWVVLVWDPWAVLQAGFWLSFVAVAVLLASDTGPDAPKELGKKAGQEAEKEAGQDGLPAVQQDPPPEGVPAVQQDRLPKGVPNTGLRWPGRWLTRAWTMLREQGVITLALAPLTLLLFGQVSLVGLLANVVAIPLITFVVTPLSFAGVLWPVAWSLANGLLAFLAQGLAALAALPGAVFSVAQAPAWAGVAGVLGGVLLVLRWPWSLRLAGLPLLLPVLCWQAPRPAMGEFALLAADVGQGNAVLVQTAQHQLLFDAGPRYATDSDAGHRVLLPLLRALDVRLDTLVLSHRDTDHTGGAAAVLAQQTGAALLSSLEASHPLQRLRAAQRCQLGQRWVWDGVVFEVLHPHADDYQTGLKPNGLSCVLRIGNGRQVALLTGDIEQPQEAQMLARWPDLHADVLLVPHHGSKTSSSAAWLDAVEPRMAWVQAGYRNRYGHPAPSVMARYAQRGVAVFASPQCGAMQWRSEAPAQLDCARTTRQRYWHAVWPSTQFLP